MLWALKRVRALDEDITYILFGYTYSSFNKRARWLEIIDDFNC